MAKLLLALLFVALAAASAVASHGFPVDSDAALEDQRPMACGEEAVLLDQTWKHEDGREWRAFKTPNAKEPILVLYWDAGNDGKADEIYLHGKQVTMAQLLAVAAMPCDLIRKGA